MDDNFTKSFLSTIGQNANPRAKQVFSGLIKHLHTWALEERLTTDELMLGLNGLVRAGEMSDSTRNEPQLIAGVIGLESLVDDITFTDNMKAGSTATSSAILGPFWRINAPMYNMGDSIVKSDLGMGGHTFIHGKIIDASTKKPIKGAELDLWHTAPNGFYEQQDPEQPDMNCRGRFITKEDGTYSLICLRPKSYPIPYDGPAGDILKALDRHPYRPAHIHFLIKAPGYTPLITQIFDREDKYVSDDSVAAVKENLIVDFQPVKNNSKYEFELPYDFQLSRGKSEE